MPFCKTNKAKRVFLSCHFKKVFLLLNKLKKKAKTNQQQLKYMFLCLQQIIKLRSLKFLLQVHYIWCLYQHSTNCHKPVKKYSEQYSQEDLSFLISSLFPWNSLNSFVVVVVVIFLLFSLPFSCTFKSRCFFLLFHCACELSNLANADPFQLQEGELPYN